MRKMIALVLIVAVVMITTVPTAEAHGAAAAALGLASFAVFTSLFVAPFFYPRYVYAAPVYFPAYQPIVVGGTYFVQQPSYQPSYSQTAYAQSPYQSAYAQSAAPAPRYAAPAPRYSNVVHYPHGRYELRGDGIQVAYQWVWIPNPPAPPPVAQPTASTQYRYSAASR